MEIRKKIKRTVSICLAASMTIMTGSQSFGKAAGPVCDEALYVTMDPYGTIKESSVVKSYDLNGAGTIVDYGTYSEINNMTDYAVPTVENEKVTFTLDEVPVNGRFYFEGKMNPEEVGKNLPWDITVRYKLNGVEKKMEELAHEKGLVEIFIDAVPNKNTSDYYRNNMTLEITSIVDMDKNLSVEAPGAQLQSVGNMKAVLFMILPGEEQHYEIRIGSDDFEFSGLAFMMVPVTLSQLDRLEDLRDARDTVKDSADAIGDSLDVILDSLEGLQDGLGGTVAGLKQLDESRKIISSAKDGIYVDADNALAVLKELSDRGVPFTSYVKDAQNALSDMNKELNQLNDSVQDLDTHLENLGYGLKHVSSDLDDVADLLNDTRHDIGSYESKLADLRRDLEELKAQKEAVNEKLLELKKILGKLKALEQAIKDHDDVLGITDAQKAKLMELIGGLIDELPDEAKPAAGQIIASYSNAVEKALDDAMSDHAGTAQAGLSQLIKILEVLVGTLEKPSKLDTMITSVTQSISTLENIIYRVHKDGDSLENVLDDTAELSDTLKRTSYTGQDLLKDVDRLTEIMNTYHETAENSLDDAGLLIDSAVRGTNTMYVLMSDVESNLKAAGDPLNKGAKMTIDGLSNALSNAIDGLSKTGVIRDAKGTVEDLVDEKWDEYTGEDMTILNADVNAKKVSFTSDENPEPQSIQIILRTEGTEEAEDEAEVPVDEDFHAQGNFLERIWSILVRIVDTIKGLFK